MSEGKLRKNGSLVFNFYGECRRWKKAIGAIKDVEELGGLEAVVGVVGDPDLE